MFQAIALQQKLKKPIEWLLPEKRVRCQSNAPELVSDLKSQSQLEFETQTQLNLQWRPWAIR